MRACPRPGGYPACEEAATLGIDPYHASGPTSLPHVATATGRLADGRSVTSSEAKTAMAIVSAARNSDTRRFTVDTKDVFEPGDDLTLRGTNPGRVDQGRHQVLV